MPTVAMRLGCGYSIASARLVPGKRPHGQRHTPSALLLIVKEAFCPVPVMPAMVRTGSARVSSLTSRCGRRGSTGAGRLRTVGAVQQIEVLAADHRAGPQQRAQQRQLSLQMRHLGMQAQAATSCTKGLSSHQPNRFDASPRISDF
jgi:hypothetical protein